MKAIKNQSKQDYETPWELFNPLHKEFKFEIDVCANHNNRKVKYYFSEARDGLEQSWANSVCWLNPPHNNIGAWLRKAHDESRQGATVVCLLPNDCSTKWWKNYVMKADEIRWINKRVKFIGATGTPIFSSVIVVFRHKPFRLRKRPKVSTFSY